MLSYQVNFLKVRCRQGEKCYLAKYASIVSCCHGVINYLAKSSDVVILFYKVNFLKVMMSSWYDIISHYVNMKLQKCFHNYALMSTCQEKISGYLDERTGTFKLP